MTEPIPAPPLRGSRRELTREMFEELAALQCRPEEIAGWTGTTLKKLNAWCRRVYRKPLETTLEMVRQDGLSEIRRAGFEQLRRSAALVQQQYNRFLPPPEDQKDRAALRAAEQLIAAADPAEDAVRELFADV